MGVPDHDSNPGPGETLVDSGGAAPRAGPATVAPAAGAPHDEELPTELEADEREDEASLGAGRTYLIITQGDARRVIELADGATLVVGRGDEADVHVDETKVSRAHARLTRRGPLLMVRDLESTNGTRLNGITLRNTERRLAGGDVLGVGSAELTVAQAAGAARSSSGRLEHELSRVAAGAGGEATLLRVALPEDVAGIDALAPALAPADLVEEREAGEYAALVAGHDALAARAMADRLAALVPGVRCGVAVYPRDGRNLAALWRAAAPAGGAARPDEGHPSGGTGQLRHEGAPADAIEDGLPQDMVVADPVMMKVYRVARRVARTDTTVLVLGETGSGKEVVAEQIHRSSARGQARFIRLNCASLPETLLVSELFGHERGAFTGADRRKIGYFEAAHGGTLLLDEIGELSLSMQVKLLRVLETRCVRPLGGTEERPVDVRVICATHRDLRAAVAEGSFREDLFYRVSGFTLRVPPLRERPTEIAMLSELFLGQLRERHGRGARSVADAARATLIGHSWPGNVRELKNAIEHAFVMCEGDTIEVEHFPQSILSSDVDGARPNKSVRDDLARIERSAIVKALEQQDGNQTHAARQLGMSRRALIYKMAKYDLKRSR